MDDTDNESSVQMELIGKNIVAGEQRAGSGTGHAATNPATGERLEPVFTEASSQDVSDACEAAWAAFLSLARVDALRRADLLDGIAAELEAIRDTLLPRVMLESGLPQGRVEGELGRTTGQLRLFAQEVCAGHWRGIRIDTAIPDRQPLPRPDLRVRRVPLGPVAVFGASNFPLAFSVAGGDTASAMAAGCPVVAKAHPAHPGTSELVGGAIARAVDACGLPAGMFSLLHGGREVGEALVRHEAIKAVGFTGSRQGGLALSAIAAAREEPIPVFAEMSSVNPVLIFPGALRNRADAIGAGLAGSIAQGAGQFCTNPGVVLVIGDDGNAIDRLRTALGDGIRATAPQAMLTEGILSAYMKGVEELKHAEGVAELAHGEAAELRAPACVFETRASVFAQSPDLQRENFGASSILVRCPTVDDALRVLGGMEGQLTATLQIDAEDHAAAAEIVPALERLAGRILVNGYPTGVEVSHAMVHGGPFPATSDSRSTSVGTLAIDRFLRPVCYQNFPADLLPPELSDTNPTGAMRRVNGNI